MFRNAPWAVITDVTAWSNPKDSVQALYAHLFIIFLSYVSAQTDLSKRPKTDPSNIPYLALLKSFPDCKML